MSDKPQDNSLPVAPEVLARKLKQLEDIPTEIGGPQGPEPTRFGDWERNGRCIDF